MKKREAEQVRNEGRDGRDGETRNMGRRNLLQMYISIHDQPHRLTSPPAR